MHNYTAKRRRWRHRLPLAGFIFGLTFMQTAVIGTVSTGLLALSVPAAEAQSPDPAQDRRRARRPARRDVTQPREPVVRPPFQKAAAIRVTTPRPVPVPKIDLAQRPPETLVAMISLARQQMIVYGPAGVVATTRISSGKSGNATPTGVFSVLQRNRYHESNIYSNAPMPFMQRLTWSGVALHQGVVPGYPASHGCVRMPADFAPQMWGLGRIGMRVLVSPTDIAPVTVSHPRLPVPILTQINGADLAGLSIQRTSTGDGPAPETAMAPLAPYAFAHVRRARALAAKSVAETDLRAAQEASIERSAAANLAADRLRAAHAAFAAAEGELEKLQHALARVQAEAAESEMRRLLIIASERLDSARRAVDTARQDELSASDAAFDAVKTLKATQARVEETAEAARLAAAALEPISIFISRKEGKVFVRQGFLPIHDEPITIAEPERPLGTHIFTAIDISEGGAALRWQVATLPSNPPPLEPEGRRRGIATPVAVQLPASAAANVLDRFELPPATLKVIGDRLWNGASLIVSDFGLGPETGKGTDFVVLTK